MGTQTLTEKPSEGTGKRGSQSISQGERPREEPTCQHLDLGLPSLQNGEKMYFCCLRPQAKILGFGSPSKLTQHVCLRACAHVKRYPESRQRTTRDNQRALLLQVSGRPLQASPPGIAARHSAAPWVFITNGMVTPWLLFFHLPPKWKHLLIHFRWEDGAEMRRKGGVRKERGFIQKKVNNIFH